MKSSFALKVVIDPDDTPLLYDKLLACDSPRKRAMFFRKWAQAHLLAEEREANFSPLVELGAPRPYDGVDSSQPQTVTKGKPSTPIKSKPASREPQASINPVTGSEPRFALWVTQHTK